MDLWAKKIRTNAQKWFGEDLELGKVGFELRRLKLSGS